MFDGARPGELVESPAPRVTLRNAFAHPFDSAIAAARTCYSPRLIGPEEIKDRSLWKQLAQIYNGKYGGDVYPILESCGGNVYRFVAR